MSTLIETIRPSLKHLSGGLCGWCGCTLFHLCLRATQRIGEVQVIARCSRCLAEEKIPAFFHEPDSSA